MVDIEKVNKDALENIVKRLSPSTHAAMARSTKTLRSATSNALREQQLRIKGIIMRIKDIADKFNASWNTYFEIRSIGGLYLSKNHPDADKFYAANMQYPDSILRTQSISIKVQSLPGVLFPLDVGIPAYKFEMHVIITRSKEKKFNVIVETPPTSLLYQIYEQYRVKQLRTSRFETARIVDRILPYDDIWNALSPS